MNFKIALALGAALLFSLAASAAQFVEVAADIEVTSWRYLEETGLPLKSSKTFSVHCVTGTNMWLIEYDTGSNYKESVWFLDGNLIRQIAVTHDTISDELGNLPGRRGARSANITLSPDGYPGGDLFLNLPWFAFCSGSYLKRPGRTVPLPTPTGGAAFGFADETTVFTDNFGLPRRVQFFTAQRQLKCDYQVQQSTNVSGWNFPTAFTVMQNNPDSLGQWKRQLSISGRVTSIRSAKKPELPEDIQERLKFWEQSPRRRK